MALGFCFLHVGVVVVVAVVVAVVAAAVVSLKLKVSWIKQVSGAYSLESIEAGSSQDTKKVE
jgi:hypothetical protein